MTKPDAEPMTNIATDVIEGYKTGLAGGPMGFVSAAFDCGWLTGAHERAALSEQPSPIDMVLHCPVCGVQHIDAPDWHNDPHSGAVRLTNGKQSPDATGNGASQQSTDESLPLLLRQGGMVASGHAGHPLQEMPVPTAPIRRDNEDLHKVQDGKAPGRVLPGLEDGQPSPAVQDLPSSGHRCVGGEECRSSEERRGKSESSQASDEPLWFDPRGVPVTPSGARKSVRDMRQAGAADPQERGAFTGSLPHDWQDQRGAVLSLQHDVGIRERRFDAAPQRDQVSGEAPLRAPSHRSHLCRPEDGGCGHIWRPADVATNGVAAIKTRGKNDSPMGACAHPVAHPAPVERVTLSEEDIRHCANVAHGRGPNTVDTLSGFSIAFARAVIAEYERLNGISATPRQPLSEANLAALQSPAKAAEDARDVLAEYTGNGATRQWVSTGAWLYPGERIEHVYSAARALGDGGGA